MRYDDSFMTCNSNNPKNTTHEKQAYVSLASENGKRDKTEKASNVQLPFLLESHENLEGIMLLTVRELAIRFNSLLAQPRYFPGSLPNQAVEISQHRFQGQHVHLPQLRMT